MIENHKSRIAFRTVVLLFLFVLAFIFSLVFGAQKLSFGDLFSEGANFSKTIFFNIRLPRSLLALLTGCLLGGAGAVFQMYFRNPLAEPGIMGISSGATMGAAIALAVFGQQTFFSFLPVVNLGAFFGALGAGFLVTALAFGKRSGNSTVVLLLCGTALGTLFGAITSILNTVFDKQLRTMYMWMQGSFSGRAWNELGFIVLPALVSLVLLVVCSRQLDLLTGGEETAASLGLNVARLRIFVLVSGTLAVSCAVCAGGTIGFVGLIAPHIVRRLFDPKGKVLVPVSMILGAVLLLVSDTVCRVAVAPAEIPVGIVMSVLGVPFFIALIFNSKGRGAGRF